MQWQTRLPFPECKNKTEPRSGSGGRGDSPREPQLKQNQSHTRDFIFSAWGSLGGSNSYLLLHLRQLKKGWWIVNPASAKINQVLRG